MSESETKPGAKPARYLIEERLGGGGMGEVFRAFDSLLKRRVALKRLKARSGPGMDTQGAADRMLREARAAAAFMHPNAVQVFDVGELEGTPFIAMELVEGTTLRAELSGTAPWKRRLEWLLEAARALAAAHAAGLVHRDIKPDNIMIRSDGAVKVLDFGIARQSSAPVDPLAQTGDSGLSTLTAEGAVVGTPAYMAPEQLRGDDVDGRTDQFAWGVTAYEALAGKLPWRGKDALGLAAAVLSDSPPALREAVPALPPALEAAILRALAKSPEARFPGMTELIAAIEPLLRGAAPTPPTAPTPPGPLPTTAAPTAAAALAETVMAPPRRRPLWPLLVLAVVAAAAGAAALWFFLREEHPQGPQPTLVSRTLPAVLRHPCPEGSAPACAEQQVPWCNAEGKRIACCGRGLIAAASNDGECACPEGFPLPPEAQAAGCTRPAVPAAKAGTIHAMWRTAQPELRACYQQALVKAPRLHGRLDVRIELTPEGDVFSAELMGSSFPDPTGESCVLGLTRKLRFPPPFGGTAVITMPLVFGPASGPGDGD